MPAMDFHGLSLEPYPSLIQVCGFLMTLWNVVINVWCIIVNILINCCWSSVITKLIVFLKYCYSVNSSVTKMLKLCRWKSKYTSVEVWSFVGHGMAFSIVGSLRVVSWIEVWEMTRIVMSVITSVWKRWFWAVSKRSSHYGVNWKW